MVERIQSATRGRGTQSSETGLLSVRADITVRANEHELRWKGEKVVADVLAVSVLGIT